MRFSDFKGLRNKNILELLDIKNVYGDYYTIKLKLNDKVIWRAGEHGIFILPTKFVKGKKWRAFSVASIKEEGYLLIGTRTGENVSSFKKELISMNPGDKVKVIGPFGWFTQKDSSSPIVLIASGVGITPIRGLLKHFENDKNRPIELIYSSKDYYLFDDEINSIIKSNDKITMKQVSNKDEAQKEIAKATEKYGNSAYYYISGSFDIIRENSKFVKRKGIKGKRLVSDPFFGY